MYCNIFKNLPVQGLPGGPGVKKPPCNAEDTGLIPGEGTEILPAEEQLSLNMSQLLRLSSLEPMHHN